MSSILVNWLNQDLKLSKSVTKESISNDFANGYLFGEILAKFNLQDDFLNFLSGTGADDTLNNFERLQPKFRLLKVPIDINLATDIIFKKPGAALHTLYHLYTSLENAKKQGTSLTLLLINQASAEAKKQTFDLTIFRDQLRRRLPRKAELQLKDISKKFLKVRESQEQDAKDQEKRTQNLELANRKKVVEQYIARSRERNELLSGWHKYQQSCIENDKKKKLKEKQLEKTLVQSKKAIHDLNLNEDLDKVKNIEQNFEDYIKESGTLNNGFDFEKAGAKDLKDISSKINKRDELREDRRRKYIYNEFKNIRGATNILRQNQMIDRLLRPTYHEQRIASYMQQILNEKQNMINARLQHIKASKEKAADIQRQNELKKLAEEQAEKSFITKSIERVLNNRQNVKNAKQKQLEQEKLAQETAANKLKKENLENLIKYKNLSKNVKIPQVLEDLILKQTTAKDDLLDFDTREIENPQNICENNSSSTILGAKSKSSINNKRRPSDDVVEEKVLKSLPAPPLIKTNETLEKLFYAIQPKIDPPQPFLPILTKSKIRAIILGPPCIGKSKLIKEVLERNQKMHHITVESAISQYYQNNEDLTNISEMEISEIICYAIDKIPQDEGFILENFPTSGIQASHFEKLMTGNGMDKIESINLPTFDSRVRICDNKDKNEKRKSAFQTILYFDDDGDKVLEKMKENSRIFDLNNVLVKMKYWEDNCGGLREFYNSVVCVENGLDMNFEEFEDLIYFPAREEEKILHQHQQIYAHEISKQAIIAASTTVLSPTLESQQNDTENEPENPLELKKSSSRKGSILKEKSSKENQIPPRLATPLDVDWTWPKEICQNTLETFEKVKHERNNNLIDSF